MIIRASLTWVRLWEAQRKRGQGLEGRSVDVGHDERDGKVSEEQMHVHVSASLGCFCFSYMFIFRRVLRVIGLRVFSGRRLISHSLILGFARECELNDLTSVLFFAFPASLQRGKW